MLNTSSTLILCFQKWPNIANKNLIKISKKILKILKHGGRKLRHLFQSPWSFGLQGKKNSLHWKKFPRTRIPIFGLSESITNYYYLQWPFCPWFFLFLPIFVFFQPPLPAWWVYGGHCPFQFFVERNFSQRTPSRIFLLDRNETKMSSPFLPRNILPKNINLKIEIC